MIGGFFSAKSEIKTIIRFHSSHWKLPRLLPLACLAAVRLWSCFDFFFRRFGKKMTTIQLLRWDWLLTLIIGFATKQAKSTDDANCPIALDHWNANVSNILWRQIVASLIHWRAISQANGAVSHCFNSSRLSWPVKRTMRSPFSQLTNPNHLMQSFRQSAELTHII